MIQPAQQYTGNVGDISHDLTPLSDLGLAWTGEADGRIIAIGGLLPEWHNRATAWTILSGDIGPHFSAVHRAVRNFLVRAPYRRIEAHVDVGFDAGIRWMKLLGFEFEVYLKAFRPDGADMLQFVRIRS